MQIISSADYSSTLNRLKFSPLIFIDCLGFIFILFGFNSLSNMTILTTSSIFLISSRSVCTHYRKFPYVLRQRQKFKLLYLHIRYIYYVINQFHEIKKVCNDWLMTEGPIKLIITTLIMLKNALLYFFQNLVLQRMI